MKIILDRLCEKVSLKIDIDNISDISTRDYSTTFQSCLLMRMSEYDLINTEKLKTEQL